MAEIELPEFLRTADPAKLTKFFAGTRMICLNQMQEEGVHMPSHLTHLSNLLRFQREITVHTPEMSIVEGYPTIMLWETLGPLLPEDPLAYKRLKKVVVSGAGPSGAYSEVAPHLDHTSDVPNPAIVPNQIIIGDPDINPETYMDGDYATVYADAGEVQRTARISGENAVIRTNATHQQLASANTQSNSRPDLLCLHRVDPVPFVEAGLQQSISATLIEQVRNDGYLYISIGRGNSPDEFLQRMIMLNTIKFLAEQARAPVEANLQFMPNKLGLSPEITGIPTFNSAWITSQGLRPIAGLAIKVTHKLKRIASKIILPSAIIKAASSSMVAEHLRYEVAHLLPELSL